MASFTRKELRFFDKFMGIKRNNTCIKCDVYEMYLQYKWRSLLDVITFLGQGRN